ncbi:MAG TPA: 7-carboxy-7-deazaguanine synthase QueE [Mycobacteriales bacterium]|jgi:organic radical activating enzyme|nr:7-carboxy-7-deazaguanine synthase QueE [Mycobacteriales bacterium]
MSVVALAGDTGSEPSPDVLYVADVFGPTFQGEGPSTGRLALFVRLGGCNLHCTWCDSGYTWDARRWDLREEIRPVRWQRLVEHLAAAVPAGTRPLLVVTGGEPLGHQGRPAFRSLLAAAAGLGLDIEVETNGTRVPAADLPGDPVYNVSPKLAHAGDPAELRIDAAALAAFRELAGRGRARFKFVVQGPGQLDEVAGIVADHRLPADAVWIMPEGVHADTVLAGGRELADPVLARGWHLTLRLHTLLWDEERGR